MSSVLISLSLITLTVSGEGITGECNTFWEKYGSTFNVCPLQLTSQSNYYTINDARYASDASVGVRYHFNVANSVRAFPSDLCESIATGPCLDYDDSDDCIGEIEEITWRTWVYAETFNKTDNTVTRCKHLSDKRENDEMYFNLYSMQVDPTEELDPTEGIKLKMFNGDYNSECSYNSDSGKNEWFELILECADNFDNVPDTEYVFYVNYLCLYYAKVESIHGCPAECGVYNNHLCASNGLCSYDFTNKGPRCVCYFGYEGTDCSTTSITTDSSITPAVNDVIADNVHTHTFQITNGDVTGNVTYNFSAAHIDNGEFKIIAKDSEWIYLIDLDSKIDTNILPEICQTSAGLPCKTFGDDNTCIEYQNIPIGEGIAFRHNKLETECQLLATEFDVKLYRENVAGKGIIFAQTNGEFCSASGSNIWGNVQFRCSNKPYISYPPPPEFLYYELSDDPYDCSYSLVGETGIACPWNCLTTVTTEIDGVNVDGWNVCNTHGTCLYDPYAGYTRCICDKGYEGSNCQTASSSSSSSDLTENKLLLIGMIALCLILIIISILFWNYYHKLNKKIKYLEKEKKKSLLNVDVDDKMNVNRSLDAAVNDDEYGDDVDASSASSDKNEEEVLLN